MVGSVVEPVDRGEVVRHWLAREQRKPGCENRDVGALDTDSAMNALLREKPGVADVLWEGDPEEWYQLRLPRDRFEGLDAIDGPPMLGWGALSPDGTILGAARRVATEPATDLVEETEIDVHAVLGYRDAIADGEQLDPLVVATRRGCAPWYVADGNHRATALALHLLETGEYEPQPAYLVVVPNPVLRPALERLCGLVRRLLGRRW